MTLKLATEVDSTTFRLSGFSQDIKSGKVKLTAITSGSLPQAPVAQVSGDPEPLSRAVMLELTTPPADKSE